MIKAIATAVTVTGTACWVLAAGAAEPSTRPAKQLPASRPALPPAGTMPTVREMQEGKEVEFQGMTIRCLPGARTIQPMNCSQRPSPGYRLCVLELLLGARRAGAAFRTSDAFLVSPRGAIVKPWGIAGGDLINGPKVSTLVLKGKGCTITLLQANGTSKASIVYVLPENARIAEYRFMCRDAAPREPGASSRGPAAEGPRAPLQARADEPPREAGARPKQAPAPPATPDGEKWIQVAENYIRNSMPAKARPYPQRVLRDCPKTPWATKAKDLLATIGE